MPVIFNLEEKSQDKIHNSKIETFNKFFSDFKVSFLIWVKIGGILSGSIILIYLIARFVVSWDILYETNVDFAAIFLGLTIGFTLAILACWFVAFFLYNTKHRRNTKYKPLDIGRGGHKNG